MIARLLRVRATEDRGFAMAFAMMITTVVLITVTTVMVVVQPGVAGSKRSQDSVAAFIAARSGIDDAIAYLMSIPSCRATTRICTAATQLGDKADSQVTTATLAAAGTPRPALVKAPGTTSSPYEQYGQSFAWAIDKKYTPEGFLRVRSTGSYQGVSKTLVADLALNPSILAYGYYTDYESFSPDFLKGYYRPRTIYLDDSSTCSAVKSSCSSSSPKYANWTGPSKTDVCAQHWYADGSTAGRYASGTNPVTESGRLGTTKSTTSGTAVTRSLGCDLTFSSAMVQNGKTFTRDAILTTGSGPKFNQPVYTMWGYKDATRNYATPAFPAAGQNYRINQGSALSNSPYVPAVAAADLTLPPTIGKDGIPENACVFTGPTRVKLNGDGTATVTSPLTRTKNATSDGSCYPASVASGVVGYRYDYNTTGGGAIVTRSIGSAPATGWPANPTVSTQTPSAANEVFYFDSAATDVARHADASGALSADCSGAVKYSAALDAGCAWTTVGVTGEGSADLGWTSYTKTACSSATASNRQLFECEYPNLPASSSPAVAQGAGQYKTVRDAVQAELAKSNCLTGTASAQAGCVNAIVQAKVNAANSASTANGAHRYVATTTAGTAATGTVATGTTAGPDGTTTDSFFTQPTPASESVTRTPLTTVVKRQVYSSSSSSWGSDTAAFTLTTTQSDYSYTPARGSTYFPNEDDVTAYNTGTDAAGTTTIRGTAQTPQSGDRQPGDLYIDGKNKGKLSVLADNDVIVTGDITNPAGYSADTDAVSITANQDVRNYHPVSCETQDTTDVNNTTPGWCPNDFTGLSTTTSVTSGRYDNMQAPANRSIQAVVFALNGSFGTDNYNRADPVGNVNIYGGLYQSHRGGNGVVSGDMAIAGATLQYTYVDLQRAALPYVPQATFGNEVRPWNVVSISPG